MLCLLCSASKLSQLGFVPFFPESTLEKFSSGVPAPAFLFSFFCCCLFFLIDFPPVITKCGAITGVSEDFVILMDVFQSMKIDGLLGMSIRSCHPTASQDRENLGLTLLLAIGIFMMQMV